MWHPFWKKKSLLEDWADIMWIHYQIQKRCLVYYAKNISLFHVMTDFYISISGLVNSCYLYVTFLFIACLEIQSIVDARHDPVNFSHSQQRFTKSSVICRSLVTYFWHLIILSCPLWVPFKTQNDHILTADWLQDWYDFSNSLKRTNWWIESSLQYFIISFSTHLCSVFEFRPIIAFLLKCF